MEASHCSPDFWVSQAKKKVILYGKWNSTEVHRVLTANLLAQDLQSLEVCWMVFSSEQRFSTPMHWLKTFSIKYYGLCWTCVAICSPAFCSLWLQNMQDGKLWNCGQKRGGLAMHRREPIGKLKETNCRKSPVPSTCTPGRKSCHKCCPVAFRCLTSINEWNVTSLAGNWSLTSGTRTPGSQSALELLQIPHIGFIRRSHLCLRSSNPASLRFWSAAAHKSHF